MRTPLRVERPGLYHPDVTPADRSLLESALSHVVTPLTLAGQMHAHFRVAGAMIGDLREGLRRFAEAEGAEDVHPLLRHVANVCACIGSLRSELLHEEHAITPPSFLSTVFNDLHATLLEGCFIRDRQGLKSVADELHRIYSAATSTVLGVPPSDHVSLQLEERTGPLLFLRPALSAEIASTANSLLIDPGQRLPQFGFASKFTEDEVRGWLETPHAHLFTLRANDVPIGQLLVFTSPPHAGAHVKEAYHALANAQFPISLRSAWAEIAIVESAWRKEVVRATGRSAYDLLTDCLAQTALALGIDQMFGEVRAGDQANLAKRSHLRVGWRDTGVTRPHGESPFDILWLSPEARYAEMAPVMCPDGSMQRTASARAPAITDGMLESLARFRDDGAIDECTYRALLSEATEPSWYSPHGGVAWSLGSELQHFERVLETNLPLEQLRHVHGISSSFGDRIQMEWKDGRYLLLRRAEQPDGWIVCGNAGRRGTLENVCRSITQGNIRPSNVPLF